MARRTAFGLSLAAITLTSFTAYADYDGFYSTLGVGYGKLGGDELIVNETAGGGDQPVIGDGCCAPGGLALSLRLGFAFVRTIAPEFYFLAHGWDLTGEEGGAGFIGGGLRFIPTGLLTVLEVLEPDFPIEFSLGAAFGYTTIGEDFAYTGTTLNFDGTLDWKATPYMSVGARLDIGMPMLSDFVFTDYDDDFGRCLDSSGQHEGIETGVAGAPFLKGTRECNGSGPSTTYLSPSLVLTLHYGFL